MTPSTKSPTWGETESRGDPSALDQVFESVTTENETIANLTQSHSQLRAGTLSFGPRKGVGTSSQTKNAERIPCGQINREKGVGVLFPGFDDEIPSFQAKARGILDPRMKGIQPNVSDDRVLGAIV